MSVPSCKVRYPYRPYFWHTVLVRTRPSSDHTFLPQFDVLSILNLVSSVVLGRVRFRKLGFDVGVWTDRKETKSKQTKQKPHSVYIVRWKSCYSLWWHYIRHYKTPYLPNELQLTTHFKWQRCGSLCMWIHIHRQSTLFPHISYRWHHTSSHVECHYYSFSPGKGQDGRN